MVSLLGFSLLCYTMKYRRTFAVFAKVPSQKGVLPQYQTLIFPLQCRVEPINTVERGPPFWCAEREMGVGTVRD